MPDPQEQQWTIWRCPKCGDRGWASLHIPSSHTDLRTGETCSVRSTGYALIETVPLSLLSDSQAEVERLDRELADKAAWADECEIEAERLRGQLADSQAEVERLTGAARELADVLRSYLHKMPTPTRIDLIQWRGRATEALAELVRAAGEGARDG